MTASYEYIEVKSFFYDLNKDDIQSILALGTQVNYKADTKIVSEGESAEYFYIISSGRVEISQGFNQSRLAILFEGDIFGEMAILNNSDRTASVTTLEPTSCYLVPKDRFLNLIQTNLRFTYFLIERVSARLYHTTNKVLWDESPLIKDILEKLQLASN
ncbi:hypothetical protein DID75_02665 [Candidatus Marinamargulisbacteria bacterium SCGC AG-410-N11]|nr:hypothetical protein DID75_02665 [Candidatus Marinamargulisbacteria bacterium SCGC AG-410-N11]